MAFRFEREAEWLTWLRIRDEEKKEDEKHDEDMCRQALEEDQRQDEGQEQAAKDALHFAEMTEERAEHEFLVKWL
jgi:hypothetical protein